MKLGKRFFALAGAGAAALLVGGGLGALHQATPAFAGPPTAAAVGCVNSTDPTLINFTTGAGGVIINPNQNPSAGTTGGIANLSVATPAAVVLCGAVVQDGGALDNDANPNTVDGGVFTATVTGPVQIFESNATMYSWNCGATAPAAAVPPAAGNETCQGGVAGVGVVTPNPGNTFHVGFIPGTSFGLLGTATPAITVSVTFARYPALGGGAVVAATARIGLLLPAYIMTLTPNPATIPAALPTSTNAPGSVITAQLYHGSTAPCVPIVAGASTLICGPGLIPIATVALVPGAESGVVTFATTSGVFSNAVSSPAGPGLVAVTGAAQVASVHCGAIPATAPTILIPTPGFVTGLVLTSCQSVSVTLVGGGAAGTADIVANFVGDFTGATAQAETTVNLTPGPITVNLTTGCNEVITPGSLAAGANGAAVVALVSGFNVTSIWVFNNATHTFQALYFNPSGPTDISSVGPNQSVFICGTGAGTFRVA